VNVYKFRGIRVDNGDWAYGSYVYAEMTRNKYGVEQKNVHAIISTLFDENMPNDDIIVFPNTVNQFAGLLAHKSHRGIGEREREMFAGDVILRHYTGSNGVENVEKLILVFEKGSFQMKRPDDCYRGGLNPNGFSLYEDFEQIEAFNKEYPQFNGSYEIIGNVYDNPEHIPPWALG
jgi:hypothetical protein